MCLEPGFRKPTKKQSEGVGWKLFRKNMTGSDCSEHLSRPTNKWIHERRFRSASRSRPEEGYGFHVLLSKKEATTVNEGRDLVLKKVRYRKAVTVGRGKYRPCICGVQDYTTPHKDLPTYRSIVAKEIFILED